jgi:MFS family permease
MSAWSPFQYRVYRTLWIALLASNIGTWMQAVGAAWMMVELHASPAIVALVQTATYLPVVVVGVAAGAIADLVERRRLLLITQACMFVAAGGLAVLTALGAVTPPLLLGFTFALGLGMAFNYPAWQAIQPELVPAEELKQAVTLGGANINLGRAIGPAVGGLLIAAAGAWLVFALNAASFAFVLVVLWRWKRSVEDDVGPPERFAGAVRAGVRYAMFSHVLHGVLVRSFVFGAASSGLLSLLPVFTNDVLGWGSGGLGILFAAIGGGAVVTAAVVPAVRERLSADRVFALGSLLVAGALVALALVDGRILAVSACFVAGIGWLFCLSTINVASQEVLPGWVRARGLALYLTAISAGIAIGAAAWGTLANAVGTQWTYAGGAAAIVATLALTWRWRFDRIAEVDLRPAPMAAPEARLVADDDASSPALVVVAYEVRPEAEDDFLRALRLVGRARRRTGAIDWSVYRDADRAHRFIETFVLPSWDEHLRQHQRRTMTDLELQEDVWRYLRPGTAPTAKHFVQPPEPSMRLWLR